MGGEVDGAQNCCCMLCSLGPFSLRASHLCLGGAECEVRVLMWWWELCGGGVTMTGGPSSEPRLRQANGPATAP
jgi:hypothetical protein